jgi:hypothetical protein
MFLLAADHQDYESACEHYRQDSQDTHQEMTTHGDAIVMAGMAVMAIPRPTSMVDRRGCALGSNFHDLGKDLNKQYTNNWSELVEFRISSDLSHRAMTSLESISLTKAPRWDRGTLAVASGAYRLRPKIEQAVRCSHLLRHLPE